MANNERHHPSAQRRALIGIAGSQLLAMTVWFSAAAVAPQLEILWGLDSAGTAALTLAVQVGFVVGALGSAIANLADIIPSRRLFIIAGLVAATTNAGLLLLGGDGFPIAVALRFLTGVALAGVYPSGLKVMAGWFTKGRGAAFGALVGALTVGSAGPHLIRGLGIDWQGVVMVASLLAVAGVVVMATVVTDGPHETAASSFSWSRVGSVVRNRGFRLSTYGYLGHMWEVYAMWTWTAAFLAASAAASGSGDGWVSIATFFIIAAGSLGAWLAGKWADRYGRTLVAGSALAISGTCAALSPLLFGTNPLIVVGVFIVWGIAAVADSAQFSTMVTETADSAERGTALTLQTAVGFLLTLVTIRGVPALAEAWGWQWAFPVLALGPALGIVAMVRLRRSPFAASLAGGRG